MNYLYQTKLAAICLLYVHGIDIESLQNRLLKVCYVPATSASLLRVSFVFYFLFLLLRALTVLMKQTGQAVRVVKQSIFLDIYGPWWQWGQNHSSSSSRVLQKFAKKKKNLHSCWAEKLLVVAVLLLNGGDQSNSEAFNSNWPATVFFVRMFFANHKVAFLYFFARLSPIREKAKASWSVNIVKSGPERRQKKTLSALNLDLYRHNS